MNNIETINNIIRLDEANKEVSIEWIKEHCSDAIKAYNNGNIIYKGMRHHSNPYFLRTENKTRRKAAYALSNLHTNIINRTNEFADYPKREHIGSSSINKAYKYGTPYIMLPLNGSKVGVCPKSDIFYSFTRFENEFNLGSFNQGYRVLIDVYESVIHTDPKFDTISELKSVFKELHDIYLEQKMVDDKHEENVEMLKDVMTEEFSHDNNRMRFFNKVIFPCIVKGTATKFLNMFKRDEKWKVQNISNLDLPRDCEVWTDGLVVMVYADDEDTLEEIFEK